MTRPGKLHLSWGETWGAYQGSPIAVPTHFTWVPPPPWPAICLGFHGKAGKFQAGPGIGCAAAAASFMSWWLIAASAGRFLPGRLWLGWALDLLGRLPVSLMSLDWRRVSQTLPVGCSWEGQANLHIWGIGEATFRGSRGRTPPHHGPLVFQRWETKPWTPLHAGEKAGLKGAENVPTQSHSTSV